MEGAALHGVGILWTFCPKQGQGFILSEAPKHRSSASPLPTPVSTRTIITLYNLNANYFKVH